MGLFDTAQQDLEFQTKDAMLVGLEGWTEAVQSDELERAR